MISGRNCCTLFSASACILFLKSAALSRSRSLYPALIRSSPAFESEEHEKAWLIRTACNVCRSMLRRASRKNESLEALAEAGDREEFAAAEGGEADEEKRRLWDAVEALPERYRAAVYLHYYEGYRTEEIAGFLKRPSSTVRNWLSEARKLLRERLGD